MAMIFTRGLCGRGILPQIAALRSPNHLQNIRCVTMKIVGKPEEKQESHDERNMRLKRELSPHLTIYKFQLTSMLSISHRITGLMLTGYLTVFGFGALLLPHDFQHYLTMFEGLQLSSASLVALKMILAFPASYHLCNGVRHLLWDSGRLLKLKEVYSSGYAMLGSAVGLTILLALL